MQRVSGKGFEYIVGDDERPISGTTLSCCGSFIGCLKAWTPCIGCFCCCCNDPYVTVPQGSKGLLLSYNYLLPQLWKI